mgnify:CR=1 FL=1
MPAIWIPKRLVDIGLINTAAENPTSFVMHCEIEYESRVIAAAAESRGGGCKVIMLTGPSASGKTTTAYKLRDALVRSGTHAVVVSLDNFYLDLENYPRLPNGMKDYENVHALDVDEIHRCLLALIETGKAEFPMFDFRTERRMAETQHIELQGGVVIVEGIHALNDLLTSEVPHGRFTRLRRATSSRPIADRIAVEVVPMLVPMTIAQAASTEISPPWAAVITIAITAPAWTTPRPQGALTTTPATRRPADTPR